MHSLLHVLWRFIHAITIEGLTTISTQYWSYMQRRIEMLYLFLVLSAKHIKLLRSLLDYRKMEDIKKCCNGHHQNNRFSDHEMLQSDNVSLVSSNEVYDHLKVDTKLYKELLRSNPNVARQELYEILTSPESMCRLLSFIVDQIEIQYLIGEKWPHYLCEKQVCGVELSSA
ncbi:hypothetical protein J5N97_015473 [Dioscorea zingiberensis]|uniref:Uncharacterized protein n=1 Tax=Dioscorea zingiberensis TaxID=325984 RepID=A0A9D5HKM1_9LILI|nr:hypothetical protein J5N97_015473 [Dioscorea zingiberensis]